MSFEYLNDKEKWIIEKTLSVKNLIELLKQYPPEMKVFSTWESTLHEITKENVYVSVTGNLYIDSDDNFYKEHFAKEWAK